MNVYALNSSVKTGLMGFPGGWYVMTLTPSSFLLGMSVSVDVEMKAGASRVYKVYCSPICNPFYPL